MKSVPDGLMGGIFEKSGNRYFMLASNRLKEGICFKLEEMSKETAMEVIWDYLQRHIHADTTPR